MFSLDKLLYFHNSKTGLKGNVCMNVNVNGALSLYVFVCQC